MEKPKKGFRCSKNRHLNEAIAIDMTKGTKDVYLCKECFIEKSYNQGSLINLCESLANNTEQIIINWPPGVTGSLADKLNNITKKGAIQEKIAYVYQIFDNLLREVQENVEISRKRCLAQIENDDCDSRKILDIYNEISKREKLAQVVETGNLEELTSFFAEMTQKSQENINILSEMVVKEQQICLQKVKNALRDINPLLSSICILKMNKEFQFIKSEYKNSSLFTINKDEKTQKVIVLNNKEAGYAYSDLLLDNNKKYIIRFSFSQPLYKMNNSYIGIVHQTHITAKTYDTYYLGTGCKGKQELCSSFWLSDPMYDDKENIFQIEMRVCIADNVFEFRDYPNLKTRNYLKPRESSAYPLNVNEQWRIMVVMNSNNGFEKSVTVESVIEADEFPDI